MIGRPPFPSSTSTPRHSPLPLTSAKPNEPARIVSIAGGASVQARLASLGMFPTEPIRVLRCNRRGPLLLQVRGSKLALGRGLCKHIFVEQAPAST